MEVMPGYKRTDIGVIPQDWDVRELGEGIKLYSGHHVLAQYCNSEGKGFPYITGPSDFAEGSIQHTKFTTRPTTICAPNDILVTVKGSGAGTIVVSDNEYCISRQLMAIRPAEWNSQYLYYSLLHSLKDIGLVATGLIPGLSRSDLLTQQIAVPPLPEQRAIAAALSDMDALIRSLDELLAKKRDLKQAAMQQLLTGKQRLPGFTGKWETRRLGDLFEFLQTANNSRSDLSKHEEVGYVHYGDIHMTTRAFLDCDATELPRLPASKVSGVPLLKDGDLIMADASEDISGIGKCVEVLNINGDRVVAGLHTFLLRGDRRLIADGFKGYLQFLSAVKSALARMATGISVYGISKTQVKTIKVNLPSVSEQTAIAAVLSDMDAEIAALEQRREKTRIVKQGMMQELLTGRTRLV